MKRKISTLMMASTALAVGMALMPLSATAKKPSTVLNVDCDVGQSLQAALDNTKLREPITIHVKGECNDGPFAIRQDVRLIGSPTAHLSAPTSGHDVVGLMNGAYAELANLTLDASGQVVGIAVHDNSTADINYMTISGASEPAINIADTSYAWILNSEMYGNGAGLQVTQTAAAWLENSNVHDNNIGVITALFSGLSLAGNTITNNTSSGVVVAAGNSYGNVILRGTPNTIESNGTDVTCGAGGVVDAQLVQESTTGTTFLDDDCRVGGTIF